MIWLAYALVTLFFVMEWRMRQGEDARRLQAGEFDRDSTRVVGGVFALTLILLIAAPILDRFQLATIDGAIVGDLGLVTMVMGLALRYWAYQTLGAFYTRTLLVKADHELVEHGPYRVVRNPGYLGILMLFVGAGLATQNWLVSLVIMSVLVTAYTYRIRAEEAMLRSTFGNSYQAYMARTWRLIPLVY